MLHLDRSYVQDPFTEDDLFLADALAAHVSAAIESAQLLRRQKEFFLKTLEVLAQAVEMRDDYTGGHTRRVTRYATMLAQYLQLPEEELELIKLGTPLHDIGKIGIDDAILRKPGRLTAAEFAVMQEHTTKGADILATIPEMVAKIYADVAPALHPMAAQSVESHLKKLAREGRVLETVVRGAPSRWLLVR